MIRRTLLTAIGEWSLLAFASVPATAATVVDARAARAGRRLDFGRAFLIELARPGRRSRCLHVRVHRLHAACCRRFALSTTAHSRRDLAVVGVHTPEVPSYQRRRAYLERETRAAAIPVGRSRSTAASRIWNAFGVSAWPTLLVFDRPRPAAFDDRGRRPR